MKKCPRCDRTYPDSESFYEADGSALAPATPAFVESAGDKRECPVCGGKAEPGEVICNFCGARLEDGGQASPPPPSGPTRVAPPPPPPPSSLRSGATQVHTPAPDTAPPEEEEGGGFLGTIGYVVAAVIALAAGAWFAMHLSSHKAQVASQPSPSEVSSPAAPSSGPLAVLANTLPVQVSGAGSNAPERDANAARQAFADNRGSLLDAYTHALSADPKTADAMAVRIRIEPDGTIDRAAI